MKKFSRLFAFLILCIGLYATQALAVDAMAGPIGECGCVSDAECPQGTACVGASTLCLVSCACPMCAVCAGICCGDNNLCTIDSADPAIGCVYTPKVCNDNNLCTIDACNPAIGCRYTAVNCPTGQACDPATGNCVIQDLCADAATRCNDNNLCTDDTCDPATGNCIFTPNMNCCIPACNDGNDCTSDYCDMGGCFYYPLPDGTPCTGGICRGGVCEICVKQVIIRGGGQRPSTTDLEIQTEFTVINEGCIVDWDANSITVTLGTVLVFDWKKGFGPLPCQGVWDLLPLAIDSIFVVGFNQITDGGTLYLDNKCNGGSDVDRITIKVAK